MPRILAVTGWRQWTDVKHVEGWLEWCIEGGFDLVRFGDATGVDEIARQWVLRKFTKDEGPPHSRYYADWDRYGKSAGPRRNRQMLLGEKPGERYANHKANLLLAFPEPGRRPGPGSGSWGCVGEAWVQGIEVKIPAYSDPGDQLRLELAPIY